MLPIAFVVLLALIPPAESIDSSAWPARDEAVLGHVGPHLSALIRARRQGGDDLARAVAERRRVDVAPDGTLDVEVRTGGTAPVTAAELIRFGVRIVAVRGDRIGARIALADVEMLAAHVAGRGALSVPIPAQPTATEGVVLTGADVAHGLGATGHGCRLAVIDAGFIGLSNLIGMGLLPTPIVTKNYTSSGLEKSSGHGTAVADIAHQMAPDADLILIKIATLSHFENALAYAKSKNADVVNVSLGFPGANFSDGKGPAADAVEDAVKDGVLVVVSAGNNGDGHWLGGWSDVDQDKFLEFGPNDEGLTFAASSGSSVSVHLVWDDFPTSDQDVDLAVYYVGTDANPQAPSQANLMGFSTTIQNGFQSPFETVAFSAPATGNYAAFVNRAGKKPSMLALFVSHEVTDGNNVAASSLLTPGDSKKALTVGAMRTTQWLTGPVEPFSARGPNLSGDPKPDIVGPDGTTSALPSFSPFFGTSAAAPHVAGAACALKSMVPGLKVGKLRTRLLEYAKPIPGGAPNDSGAGRLDLTADFFAPTPNPAQIDVGALVVAADSITLTSAAAGDATGPLEYRFTFKGKQKKGVDASDWSTSPSFTDDGLTPNTVYKHLLTVRDAASIVNVTEPSSVVKVRTLARVPPAPILTKLASASAKVQIATADNPPNVEYAILNVTDATYVAANGTPAGPDPVFRTASDWGIVKVKSLTSSTPYELRAQARNGDGVTTPLSPPLAFTTNP